MPPVSRPSGFTLIELLVVVALLSAASLLAFSSFGEDRAQRRHDDTRLRMQQLRSAILGQSGPSTASLASGYVADNGALPATLAALAGSATGQQRGALAPVFVPAPDSNCTGSGVTIDAASAQLVKGLRGDYLGGLAVNGRFRDGWGNVGTSDDEDNFGWIVAGSETSLSLSSLGADNVAGGEDYAADQTLDIAADDWLLPLAGWTVTVTNARLGSDSANDVPGGRLSLSLLVFVNDAEGGKWRRYASTSLPCLDGNGDGDVAGLACARSASVAFTDACQPGGNDGRGRIPHGRHLLVLTDNGSDGTPWTSDDVVVAGPTLSGSTPILTQIDALAGRNLPAVTLEFR